MKGSMTVEAAYVFPLCFLIIGIVCYLGIYEYNLAVLKMTGYECILQTMEERSQGDEVIKALILQRGEKFGKARVLGVENLTVSVNMTPLNISLVYKGMQIGLNVPVETKVSYQRTYPELTLMLTDVITGEQNE